MRRIAQDRIARDTSAIEPPDRSALQVRTRHVVAVSAAVALAFGVTGVELVRGYSPLPLYLPLCPRGGSWAVTTPVGTGTPTPQSTASMTVTPTPEQSPPATPKPTAPPVEVVFQAADHGGLPSPPWFQEEIRRAPWITVYEDGTYVRAVEIDHHELVTSRLAPVELNRLLDRLEVEGGFFDYPEEDQGGRCVTDGQTTYSLLRRDARTHRVASYLMLWLGMYPQVCPPGGPGMPIGPETDRFFALAGIIADLNARLTEAEEPYQVDHATVLAESAPNDAGVANWPLSVPITTALGTDTLAPDDYATLESAVRRHRPYPQAEYAVFRQGVATYAVGVRAEMPGWLAYCEGKSWCHP
jgi:hypothetical protein